MSGPKTAAGEAFRHDLTLGGWPWDDATRRILAIEAEARATADAQLLRLRDALDHVLEESFDWRGEGGWPRAWVRGEMVIPVSNGSEYAIRQVRTVFATADAAPAEPSRGFRCDWLDADDQQCELEINHDGEHWFADSEPAEPRWPSGEVAERELAAALMFDTTKWWTPEARGWTHGEFARAILAALQEKRDPGE